MRGFNDMMQPIRSCHRGGVKYHGQVRLTWKILWLAVLAALPLAGAGCSGVNASQSVSPIDFFLPGAAHFLKASPPATNAPASFPETPTEVASVN
jgi:hypothetical protein